MEAEAKFLLLEQMLLEWAAGKVTPAQGTEAEATAASTDAGTAVTQPDEKQLPETFEAPENTAGNSAEGDEELASCKDKAKATAAEVRLSLVLLYTAAARQEKLMPMDEIKGPSFEEAIVCPEVVLSANVELPKSGPAPYAVEDEWNPQKDAHLTKRFRFCDDDFWAARRANKVALQAELGLKVEPKAARGRRRCLGLGLQARAPGGDGLRALNDPWRPDTDAACAVCTSGWEPEPAAGGHGGASSGLAAVGRRTCMHPGLR